MKKLLLTVLLITLGPSLLFAQKGRDRHEEIQTIKIGFLTKKLNLSSEQAKVFWPIYNEFEKENMQLRRSFGRQYHKDNPEATRREAMDYINADLDYQEQKLALRKELVKSLKGKITDQQVADLFIAEREFRTMLLKRLRNKNSGGNRGGGRRR